MVKRALALEAVNEVVDNIRGKSRERSSDKKRKYESGNVPKAQQTTKKAGKAPVGGKDAMAGRGRRSAQSRTYEQSRKIKKFVKGLKPSLKARLLEFDPYSLEEVLGMANRQESRVESYQGEKEAQKEGVPETFQRQDRKMKKLMEGQQ
ncbi:hypothetical protein Taro_002475 [Colocasia esculenta]|uniref:Uncharacterized protein n=1 Tax=Colocasia esculenta TaxID=4460 RepID=A0A843TGP0_COLES|nr:hypothetical protein [Colocasia esculenta]